MTGRVSALAALAAVIVLTTSDACGGEGGGAGAGFGRNGEVVADLGSSGSAAAVAIQRDGKIIAAGAAVRTNALGGQQFALARFTASGRLDRSFGTGGSVLTRFGWFYENANDAAAAIAIQRDGKIVAVGQDVFGDFAVARYTRGGRLDPTITARSPRDDLGRIGWERNISAGMVAIRFGRESQSGASAVAIQRDGKIVVAGTSGPIGYAPGNRPYRGELAVARLTPDGRLDPSFAGGRVLTEFGSKRNAGASAVAIQDDGR